MKKLALSLVVAGVVASSALAEGAFVGVEGGVTTEFLENNNQTWESFNRILGIKGGYDFDKYRIYGQLNRTFTMKFNNSHNDEYEDENTIEVICGGDFYLHQTSDFKLFVGAYAGLESLKFTYYETRNRNKVESEKTKTDFMIGSKVGVSYLINDASSIELGMKLDKPFHSDIDITKFSTFAGFTYKF